MNEGALPADCGLLCNRLVDLSFEPPSDGFPSVANIPLELIDEVSLEEIAFPNEQAHLLRSARTICSQIPRISPEE